MKDMIRQLFLIILCGSILGVVANQVRHDMPLIGNWSPEARLTAETGKNMVISLEEAKRLFSAQGALFLDARPSVLYEEGHIKGARNVPWQSFGDYLDEIMDIPEDAMIITYCDGETCSLSEDLAKELLSMGFENVRVLVNGWTRWKEAGLTTERGGAKTRGK